MELRALTSKAAVPIDIVVTPQSLAQAHQHAHLAKLRALQVILVRARLIHANQLLAHFHQFVQLAVQFNLME